MTHLKIELLKIKRLKGLHLVYLVPLFTVAISFFEMIKRVNSSELGKAIPPFSNFYFQFYVFFSPVVIILILFTLIQIENKNRMWESNFLIPVTKNRIYLTKVLVIVTFSIIYTIISYFSYLILILFCNHFLSDLVFLNPSDNVRIMLFHIRMLVAFILYALIAMPVFIYIESAISAVGSILFLIFLGLFLANQSWFLFYPFSYHILVFGSNMSNYDVFYDKGLLMSMLYMALAYATGQYFFKKYTPLR